MKRVKDREKADKKAEKLRLKEEAKMTKEFEKVDKDIKIEIIPLKKPNVR
jgi:hypothetical protein